MPSDFDFLQGCFDVSGRRLRDLLDPASGWVEVPATSSAVVLFDGAVSVDEMWFPDEQRFGMSLRLFDFESRTWTVRWLDGCGGGLQPPVEGRWADGRCWFTGTDSYRGRTVLASYSWSEVTDAGARREQCFSLDEGTTWQPNWVMQFTRRAAPVDHPQQPRVADDFDFLTGTWNVHHRRVVDPIAQRGLTFRVHDPQTRQWLIYWVNSRVGRLEPPVYGGFTDGVGTFYGDERLAGHDVRVRFEWSDITSTTARWQQAFSVDGGDWSENWQMTFTRPDGAAR